MVSWHNRSCQGNETILSLRIVGDLQEGINNMKTPVCCHGDARIASLCIIVEQQSISYCCQQYKRIWITISSAWYCCPTLAEFEISRQIFRKRSQIWNFTQNPTSRSRTDTDIWADTTNLIGASSRWPTWRTILLYEGTSKSFRTLFFKKSLCYRHENNVTFQYNLPSSRYI